MSATVAVRVRDCACPESPHAEGDTIDLLERPTLACGLAVQADIIASAGEARLLEQRWMTTFVRHGAVGWNLVDAGGAAVPFDVEAVLADFELAWPVAERADTLYGEIIIRPLMARLNGISRTGPTAASTSPRVQSIHSRRGRSSQPASAASAR